LASDGCQIQGALLGVAEAAELRREADLVADAAGSTCRMAGSKTGEHEVGVQDEVEQGGQGLQQAVFDLKTDPDGEQHHEG
jgi:hypothetical protein